MLVEVWDTDREDNTTVLLKTVEAVSIKVLNGIYCMYGGSSFDVYSTEWYDIKIKGVTTMTVEVWTKEYKSATMYDDVLVAHYDNVRMIAADNNEIMLYELRPSGQLEVIGKYPKAGYTLLIEEDLR